MYVEEVHLENLTIIKSGSERYEESLYIVQASIFQVCENLTVQHILHTFEPVQDKINKITCVPGQDSDQPGHDQSLPCLPEECLGPKLPIQHRVKALIRMCEWPHMSFISFIVLRLIY